MEWFRNRALTLVLMAMFVLFLVGQMTMGWHEYNATQHQHGQAWITFSGYLATGHPWEALFENWESEFLQMAVFVLLTTGLVQKGSPESRRLGAKELVDADHGISPTKPTLPGRSDVEGGCSASTSTRWDLRSLACFSFPGWDTPRVALRSMPRIRWRTAKVVPR